MLLPYRQLITNCYHCCLRKVHVYLSMLGMLLRTYNHKESFVGVAMYYILVKLEQTA